MLRARPFVFERENVLIVRLRMGATLRSPSVEESAALVAIGAWSDGDVEGYMRICDIGSCTVYISVKSDIYIYIHTYYWSCTV